MRYVLWLIPLLILTACGGGGGVADVAVPTDVKATSDCDGVFDEGENPRALQYSIPAGTARSCVLRVTNLGAGASRDTSYSLAIPDAMSLKSASCMAEGGARCPATVGLGGALTDMPPGAVLQFSFLLGTTAFRNETLQARFAAHASNDGNPANDSADAIVAVESTDLSIVLSAPAQTAAGQDLIVAATLSNRGPIGYGGPVSAIRLQLPAGVEYTALELFLPDGRPFYAGFFVDGPHFNVGVGQSMIFRYHLKVTATGGSLSLRFDAPDISDPTPGDNSASVTVEVTPP